MYFLKNVNTILLVLYIRQGRHSRRLLRLVYLVLYVVAYVGLSLVTFLPLLSSLLVFLR